MANTPDRAPGPREEEEVQFDDATADGLPTVVGALRWVPPFLRLFRAGTFPDVALGLFGDELQETSDETLSSTTALDFQQKLRLTTTVLKGGTYAIFWFASLSTQNANKNAEARVQLDDSGVLAQPSFRVSQGQHDFPLSGFAVRVLSAASHTIDLDWRTLANNQPATIQRTRLMLLRIA